jgi:hypothetical protein
MTHSAGPNTSATWRWLLWGFVALSVMVAGTIGWDIWRVQRDQSEVIPYRHQAPLLVRDRAFGSERLRAWDWKQNQWIDLGPIDEATYFFAPFDEGRAIAHVEAKKLILTEISSPPRKVTIDLAPLDRGLWGYVVGISRNGRYAVLQRSRDRMSSDGSRLVHALRVIDLQTKTLVDERYWESYCLPTENEDQFASFLAGERVPLNPNEAKHSMWELGDDGHWTEIAVPSSRPRLRYGESLDAQKQSDGTWRVVGPQAPVATIPPNTVSVMASQRDDKTVIVVGHFDSKLYRLDRDSGALTPMESSLVMLDTRRRENSFGWMAYTDDEKTLLAADVNGKVAAIDVATGKVLATNRMGSVGVMEYSFAIAAALALATVWAFAACRTTTLLGWISSCTTALIFCELAATERLLACRQYDSMSHNLDTFCCAAALLGIVAGTTITVGWIWAWANFWQLRRWLLGALVLISISLPAAAGLSVWQNRSIAEFADFGFIGIWITMMRISLVFAAGNALLMGLPAWLQFRFAPTGQSGWKHYALVEVFCSIAGLAMALSLFRVGVLGANEGEAEWLTQLAIVSVAISITSVVVATVRWPKFVAVALLFVAVFGFIVAAIYFHVTLIPGTAMLIGTGLEHAINITFFVTTLLTSIIPIWLLRRQGWRWTRVAATTEESDFAAAPSVTA